MAAASGLRYCKGRNAERQWEGETWVIYYVHQHACVCAVDVGNLRVLRFFYFSSMSSNYNFRRITKASTLYSCWNYCHIAYFLLSVSPYLSSTISNIFTMKMTAVKITVTIQANLSRVKTWIIVFFYHYPQNRVLQAHVSISRKRRLGFHLLQIGSELWGIYISQLGCTTSLRRPNNTLNGWNSQVLSASEESVTTT